MIAPKILVVDDCEADLELVKLTLTGLEHGASIDIAPDGQAALDQLEASVHGNLGLPDLILLDLNMPRLDGRSFLTKLRARHELSAIPVIVLTSSDAQQDIASSYRHGASCFIKKAVGIDELQKVLEAVKVFWMDTAKLPPSRR